MSSLPLSFLATPAVPEGSGQDGDAQTAWPGGVTAPRLRLPQRASAAASSGISTLFHRVTPWRRTPWELPVHPPVMPLMAQQTAVPGTAAQSQTVSGCISVRPLRIGAVWHPGLLRANEPNEDTIGLYQGTCLFGEQVLPFHLFVVADGMGGHAGGREASRLAVQWLSQLVLQRVATVADQGDVSFLDILIGSVEEANRAVFQRGQADGVDMGTTLTAALVVQDRAYIVNVGDSRTYLFRESAGLIQITRDHSLVASLVAYGDIKPDEVYTHPERNKVYRSLGYEEQVLVDAFCVEIQSGDCLLLCSDGLWEMVRDAMMERVLRSSHDLDQLSERLLQSALQAGGEDNISAILAQIT